MSQFRKLTLFFLVVTFLTSCAPPVAQPPQIEIPDTVPAMEFTLSEDALNSSLIPADGQVIAVSFLDCYSQLLGVIQGAEGTLVMQGPYMANGQPNGYLLAYATNGGMSWTWVAVSPNGTPLKDLSAGANLGSYRTFSDLVRALYKGGWWEIKPAELPAWLKDSLITATTFIARFGSYLTISPFFIIMPANLPGLEMDCFNCQDT